MLRGAASLANAIVNSIITLAHNLKLAVIAEGVETIDQLDYLRRHDCDQMQGFYFSKPLPAEQFAALVTSAHARIDANVDANVNANVDASVDANDSLIQ